MSHPFVETKEMTVGYRGVPLIRDIALRVHRGEILTLIGPNGSGKSTILVAEQTKPSGVRIAACSRHIPAGHQLRPHMLGEQHGHRARKVTFRQSLQRFAIQIYRTADERQLTDEAFEDGRFTRAVRTDER